MINIIIAENSSGSLQTLRHTVLAFPRVIRVSALMQFILKQTTKKPINKVQRKNIFSFRHVISLICQECLISLNSKLDKADADILKKYIQAGLQK